MIRFNDMKRTRLKMVIYFSTGILVLGIYCAVKGMEGAATSAIVTIGAIVAKYTHDETKRKSIE